MISAIVIEDERYTLEYLKRLIQSTGFIEVSAAFDNPLDVLPDPIRLSAHAAFIDIEMPGIDGITLAERLLEDNPRLQIVFVTAYNQYAVQAFDLNALDYIMKPVNTQRFYKMADRLKKIIETVPSNEQKLTINCFGNFEVMINNNPVKWQRAKAEELFAYLLMNHGKKVHKDTLIEELWPNYEPARALTILQTSVCKLRNIFSPLDGLVTIKYEGSKYCLSILKCECDLFWLENLFGSLSFNNNLYKNVDHACSLLEKGFLSQNGYIWSHVKEAELNGRLIQVISDLISMRQNKNMDISANNFDKLLKRMKNKNFST